MKAKPFLYISAFILVLAGGIIAAFLSSQSASTQSVAKEVSSRLETELEKADRGIEKFVKATYNEYGLIKDIPYPVFVYYRNHLIYWSDNSFVPSYQEVADTSRSRLFKTGSEAYVLSKRMVSSDTLIVSAVKLIKRYPIVNEYLVPEYNDNILQTANVT
ncbi:MAG TPA: hypothetical protein VD794_04490, partial [Flavisolibacter sp.]|nr:hypothetical protein [Flavisolibacter sp.]